MIAVLVELPDILNLCRQGDTRNMVFVVFAPSLYASIMFKSSNLGKICERPEA